MLLKVRPASPKGVIISFGGVDSGNSITNILSAVPGEKYKLLPTAVAKVYHPLLILESAASKISLISKYPIESSSGSIHIR